jgi:hypothetical protein
VADFATHDLEHLRSEHGHRCLGIADREMLSWAEQAGLEIESERTLPPTNDAERLTVRLWLLRAVPSDVTDADDFGDELDLADDADIATTGAAR